LALNAGVVIVVEKRLVVVALVPVALRNVKFWRVEDASDQRLAKCPRPAETTEEGVMAPRVIVRFGVAPPDDEPDTPFAVVTPIAVSVPLPLLLNVDQSVLERRPSGLDALAVGMLRV